MQRQRPYNDDIRIVIQMDFRIHASNSIYRVGSPWNHDPKFSQAGLEPQADTLFSRLGICIYVEQKTRDQKANRKHVS